MNIERLKTNSIPFQKSVEDTIKPNSGRNVNERWIEFKSAILSSAQKERLSEEEGKEVHTRIGCQKKRARKPWLTEEMINKMKERRKWNNKNKKEERKIYRQINNELRRETDKARAAYWDRVCKAWCQVRRMVCSD